MTNWLTTATLSVILLTDCSTKIFNQPKKAEGIPDAAFWVGGADGGQWYVIDNIDKSAKTVHFKIYNDFTGELVVDRKLKLHCNSDNEIRWDKLRKEINAFDGKKVLLKTIGKDNKYCYFE